MVEDVADDGVEVGEVDLVVAVHIANDGPAVTIGAGHTGVTATAASVDDDVDDVVGVADVDFAVAVHVP